MDKKVIHTVFEETAGRYADKIAVEHGSANITYSNLNTLANRLAWLLKHVGCGRETIVNVVAPSSIQLVAAVLAVFKSSGIYLPVDLSFSEKRLRQVFTDTFDGIVIVSADLKDMLVELTDKFGVNIDHLIVLDDDNRISLYSRNNEELIAVAFPETNEWSNNPVVEVNGNSSNYIFYTSGSTGEGKAILGAHAGLSHFIHWETKEFGIDESFRISQLAQITFDASLRDIFSALVPGGTLCIPTTATRNDPRKLLEWIERSKISLVHCVPSLFRVLTKELQLKRDNNYDFSHLKFILMAGELLYAKDILNWRKEAGDTIQLVNLYGATETTLVKTFYRIGAVPENPAHIIPAGIPISNTVAAIIKDGHICKAGEIGEIYIKTPFMTKGYYKNEELTKECFVQNPLVSDATDIVYKTGDLGRYLPDGNIEVLGRLDSQVKVNGIRIELVEVEQAILETENISGAVVKTHRTDDNLLTLVAYYTGTKREPEEFRSALSKVINQQMIPSYFIHLDEFPLNINGKIDKKALPLPEDILMGDDNYEAPDGVLENALAEFWKEILGLKKISRNISFFSVGGHSLRAIQLVSRIQKEFDISLKIADVFTHRTIRDLAALISGSLGSEYKQIEVAGVQESYPLSSSQHRLWIVSQLEESNIAYNMPAVYEFDGEPDYASLEKAFQSLIARHEILRTVFKEDEQGNTRQFILSPGNSGFTLVYRDLRKEKDATSIIKELVQQECLRAFDLSAGPLLRAGLYQLTDDKCIFIYVMHHIISDGWSMRVLFNELLQLYELHKRKEAVALTALRIQYKDYAVWQQQQLGDAALHPGKQYWLKQFESELPVLSLPYDRSRPAIKTFNGGLVTRMIDPLPVEKLKVICEAKGGTLFMGLLAVVNTLLYRYTEQEDIIVGSPVAGRTNVDLEEQIGCYLNTLALRTVFSRENNFGELLDNIKQVTLKAYEHQAYPFDELIALLDLHDMSRNPLFDVTVVLQNTEMASGRQSAAAPVTISNYEKEIYRTSKFDLTFNFAESGNALQVGLEYNSDLFNEATAIRIVNHLEQILAAVVTDPSVSIKDLDYLSATEKQQLLQSFNDTSIAYPRDKTIVELFEEQVTKTPAKTALEFESVAMSYKVLNEVANRLGSYLQQTYNIQRDDLVGIKLERSEWLIISILGVLKAGGAYVPIDMDYPPDRVHYMLADCNCRLIIDEHELARFRKEAGNYSETNETQVRQPGSLAYIMYTSGSTGRPKGVMVEDRAVVRLVKPGSFAKLTGEEKLLSTGSFSFDATTFEYWGMLLNGGCLRLCRQEVLLDTMQLAEEISNNEIDMMWFTAGWLNQLVDTDITVFKGLKTILAGGDKLSAVHIGLLLEEYPDLVIVNGYGPTENTTFSLTFPVTASCLPAIPVGKPIDNSIACIVDSNGSLVPVGVTGEIYVGGDGLSRGYLNNAELTAEKFIPNPFRKGERLYKTGDLGRWWPDGNIGFAGRKDTQVKIRGYRVEPGEVEGVLQNHDGITAAVVIARQVEGEEKSLVAYIISNDEMNVDGIRDYLGKYLPAYMVPDHYVQLESFPLTSNGKVDRGNLPDPEGLALPGGTEYVAPANELQRQVIAVYEEILKRKSIGIKDNFFVLGGDSIKSIQIVSRLRQRGYSLAIRDILTYPVVEDLAERVSIAGRMAEQGLITGIVPLSPIQASFFQNNGEDIHHYNQSVLLYSKEPVSEAGIRMALDKIVLHHDALRMVYRQENGVWIQENRGERQTYFFEVVEQPDEETFRTHCDRIQSTIDLQEGPLLNACLFRGHDGDRLLLVAHHLVIDGVSWRILFEDLSALYQQYLSGESLSLPLKTDSFSYWQHKQITYSKSELPGEEELYWSSIEAMPVQPLPVDNPGGSNLVKDVSSCSFLLDKESTQRLLTECYRAYHTEINDVLLTALNLALKETFGVDKIAIQLEGHGREDIGAGTDITRTVGWFTTAYPVVFDMRHSNDKIRQLVEIKEVLHRVPNKGVGYGMLRYISGREYRLNPSISFNYLGDFGFGIEAKTGNQLFSFSHDYQGSVISGNRRRETILDVSGIVAEGMMRLSIAYSSKQYSASTIEGLLENYRRHLENLVQLLASEEKVHLSPVDLTYKKLSIEQVEKLNQLVLEDVYPLSPLQQGLYYHWLSAPDSPVYLQQISYQLKGRLQIELLEKSYEALMARHAILRTFFTQDFGPTPLQVVKKEAIIDFTYKDVRGDAHFSIIGYKKDDQGKGFDLHTGSQMRLSVITLDDDINEFVWSFHHILMDGWCASMLMKEFFEIYRSYVQGKVMVPGKLYPYSSYIEWLGKIRKEDSLRYWNGYLSGYDTISSLPKLSEGKKGFDAQKRSFVLDAGTRDSIRNLCRESGITENTFIQTLWGILLGKYNSTTDVVFGTVVSGRPAELKGVEEMIGLFINTIPVRISIQEEISARELLKNVQQSSIEATGHHYVQLAELQSESELGRNLFDHILVFENYPVEQIVDQGINGKEHPEAISVLSLEISEQSSYDFFITVVPGDSITFNFNYNGSVYDEAQMSRMQDHLLRLMQQVLQNPLRAVHSLDYVDEVEKQQLLNGFNDTAAVYPKDKTMVNLFEERVGKTPDKVALEFQSSSFTYKELNERANSLAAYLRQQYNIQPDDLVGVKLERSEWMILSILAVLKAGGAYVPIDPSYPQERIDYIMTDSKCKVLIDEQELELFKKSEDSYSKANLITVNKPSDLMYVIYTSGSTGRPKGCMLEHRGIVNRLEWMWQQYEYSESDIILQKTTFTFDVSVWELFMPLCWGAKMVLCEKEDTGSPERIVSLIEKHKVSCLHFVPSMLNAFIGAAFEEKQIADRLKSLRLVITSGEALPVETVKTWYDKLDVPIHNLYGPTEASVDVSYYATSKNDSKILIGEPVWNTQLYIIGPAGQLQPVGIAGEICIGGDGLARGYLNKEELTAEKFTTNPFTGKKMYRTGDTGRWNADGQIEYIGRKDNQVKIRGYRIELGEIESALQSHPDISSCAVIAKTTASGSEKELVAYIVTRDSLNTMDLRSWLGKTLPAYMIPGHYVEMETLPLTGSGKLDRKALPDIATGLRTGVEYIAARNETEEKLVTIWQEVLGKEKIGVEDNFFDAGGNSIRIIHLSNLMSKALGQEISVPLLFQYPTIKELADHLADEPLVYEVEAYDQAGLIDDLGKFTEVVDN